jgi:enoyl-CoA hydratase
MTDTNAAETVAEPDVLLHRHGAALMITLNRPKALNALNHAMCLTIQKALYDSIGDRQVSRVVIQGTGERAFCAGGDVVGLYHAGRTGSPDWERFFFDEYRMNQTIAVYPDDYVALMDGVTMGGGVGLSIHGRARVVTERTRFAMPETGIGLIPDVGGTHALAKLPGFIGTWLALTGAQITAADCLYAGIATHYVSSDHLPALREALADGDLAVADTLARFQTASEVDKPLAAPALETLRDAIDYHFAHDSVEAIQASLKGGDDWAVAQHDIIAKMSPTSCKLSLLGLRLARGESIETALINEYRMVCAIKQGHDFFEGVRALLVDKDKAPKWNPATLEAVHADALAAYSQVPAGGDLNFD